MERKNFIRKILVSGFSCGCAMSLQANTISLLAKQEDKKPAGSTPETPCNEKVEFTKKWVKRFMDILDENIDEEICKKIMITNGRECAKSAYGEDVKINKPLTLEELDAGIAEWQKIIGEENIYRKDKLVFFNYVQNPNGLKISDGYCLCPMVEDGPSALSPTYCYCSVGYVQYMFHIFFGMKVNVELIESLRTGGKGCRFKVII
jgi:hypothetical protein